MTYTRQQKPSALRRYRRPPRPALAGWLDDVLTFISPGAQVLVSSTSPDTQDCLAAANQAVAPLDAKIAEIAKTWSPTGFYTSSDLRDVVASTMKVVQRAQATVDLAASEPNASQDSIIRASDDLIRAGQRSLVYLQAATTADQQGTRSINAPGLKRWVTDSMAAASSAMVTASVIGCITPWWVGALAALQTAMDAVLVVTKRVVGVALAVGETALKIADDLPALYDILKWAALGLGGYWLWVHYLRKEFHTP